MLWCRAFSNLRSEDNLDCFCEIGKALGIKCNCGFGFFQCLVLCDRNVVISVDYQARSFHLVPGLLEHDNVTIQIQYPSFGGINKFQPNRTWLELVIIAWSHFYKTVNHPLPRSGALNITSKIDANRRVTHMRE